jgi:hypothetical protein
MYKKYYIEMKTCKLLGGFRGGAAGESRLGVAGGCDSRAAGALATLER